MDEAKGRDVSIQVGHQIMGTIGVLMAAYEEKLLSADDIKECINNLKKPEGISDKDIIIYY